MSPLEAAQQMAADPPLAEAARHGECWYCQTAPHTPDCPWLAMPQMVTVLEAAERLRQVADDPLSDEQDVANAAYDFVAALKGDTA